jgi:hypothetical protein
MAAGAVRKNVPKGLSAILAIPGKTEVPAAAAAVKIRRCIQDKLSNKINLSI